MGYILVQSSLENINTNTCQPVRLSYGEGFNKVTVYKGAEEFRKGPRLGYHGSCYYTKA